MLGTVGRKLLEGVVGLFALLGFLYVPLGRHTGLEHARAVLSTPAASAAIADVTSSVLQLRARAVDIVTGRVPPPSSLGSGETSAAEERPRGNGKGPRPVPPKLK